MRQLELERAVRESAAAEAGHAEGRREAARRRGQRRPLDLVPPTRRGPAAVEDLELLEVVEGGGSEPAVECRRGGVVVVGEVVDGEGEVAAGARVRGEDASDLSELDLSELGKK